MEKIALVGPPMSLPQGSFRYSSTLQSYLEGYIVLSWEKRCSVYFSDHASLSFQGRLKAGITLGPFVWRDVNEEISTPNHFLEMVVTDTSARAICALA